MGRKPIDNPKSEVVKIRISKATKDAIAKSASESYRTFQQQVCMILDEWVFEKDLNQKETT